MTQPASITDYAELIAHNATAYSKGHPEVSGLAEAVNGYLDALLSSHLELPSDVELQMGMPAVMALAARHSWTTAYILSSAGLVEAGLASLRRCVEFTCWAAKVKGNKGRVLDWMKHLSDSERRLSFTRWSSIPLAFRHKKYRFLRPLMLSTRIANKFVHGNLAAMAGNLNVDAKGLKWSFVNEGLTDQVTPLVASLGYRLACALTEILEPLLKNSAPLAELLESVGRRARNMRLQHAAKEGSGSIPAQRLRAILLDDLTGIDEQFEEFVQEEEDWNKFRRNRRGRGAQKPAEGAGTPQG